MTIRNLQRKLDHERRLRRAAVTGASREPPEPADAPEEAEDDSTPGQRMEQQALWVDLQVREAMERGEFDNLPGAGKPIPGLGPQRRHDPDWWVKNLIQREQITDVLPPALGLRKEDAQLGLRLDREGTEEGVRRTVADFNERVVQARRQLLGGPPVVTSTRVADEEVAAWRARRAERRGRARNERGRPDPSSDWSSAVVGPARRSPADAEPLGSREAGWKPPWWRFRRR